jgi:hypothetical protein
MWQLGYNSVLVVEHDMQLQRHINRNWPLARGDMRVVENVEISGTTIFYSRQPAEGLNRGLIIPQKGIISLRGSQGSD